MPGAARSAHGEKGDTFGKKFVSMAVYKFPACRGRKKLAGLTVTTLFLVLSSKERNNAIPHFYWC